MAKKIIKTIDDNDERENDITFPILLHPRTVVLPLFKFRSKFK